jgi:nitrogenase molybdenum-iron protein beta chain
MTQATAKAKAKTETKTKAKKEVKRSVTINPGTICQPIGAMQAVLGVHGAISLVHGSQGCAAYPMRMFNRHFQEPVEIALSSLGEDAAVFGGADNLVKGVHALVARRQPELIAVLTTCLSETIGDDVNGILRKIDLPSILVPVHTPSYVGSHVTGYDNAVKALVTHLAEQTGPNSKINIAVGLLNPGDIRELKNMLAAMRVKAIILTDISETLDAPLILPRPRFPDGGTTPKEIADTANSIGSIALCKHAGGAAVKYLAGKHKVPMISGSCPIGVANTDAFLENVSHLTGRQIPDELRKERGRLIDAMIDVQFKIAQKRVAIHADPDVASGMARFVHELGMEPAIIATGTESKEFVADVQAVASQTGHEIKIISGCDLYELHEAVKAVGVDLVMGNSQATYIGDDEKTAFARIGFPVYDRVGYQRRAIIGYGGGINLVDRITNAILDHADSA